MTTDQPLDASGPPDAGTSPRAPEPVAAGRFIRFWQWIRTHKLRSLLIVLGAAIIIEAATIPWFGVHNLRKENPGETALMRQRVREAERDKKKLRIVQKWVPLAKLPRHLIDAVVVAEDGTFYTHGGVDWFEVRESVEKNLKEFRAARGASTITQQLAKNLYLSTSKDPVRKAKELVITLLLENFLTKDRILEIYLNVIEWGRGVFGVEAAAQTFFGKPAHELTLEESTRLAAVIPSPLRHSPNVDSRYVLRRSDIVMRRLEARWAWREQKLPPPVPPPQLDFPEDSSTTSESEADGLQGY